MKNNTQNVAVSLNSEVQSDLELIKTTIKSTDTDIKKNIDEENKRVLDGLYND
jgi:hypothetical protein